MFHERMKEAKVREAGSAKNTIRLFEFPDNHHNPPFLEFTHTAFKEAYGEWRWLTTGVLLSSEDDSAINAELTRRRVVEIIKKSGEQ